MAKAVALQANDIDERMLKIQKHNSEYLAKLELSAKQAERGEVVRYTKEQMKALEND